MVGNVTASTGLQQLHHRDSLTAGTPGNVLEMVALPDGSGMYFLTGKFDGSSYSPWIFEVGSWAEPARTGAEHRLFAANAMQHIQSVCL